MIRRDPPIRYGRRIADFESNLDPEFPDLGVLELEEGYVIGPDGWVVSREEYLLPEHSWYGLHMNNIRLSKRPFEVVRLKGVCLTLASDWAADNFGHFLLDSVTRFDLFKKAGFDVTDVDHVYYAAPNNHSDRFLEMMGIPREKLIKATRGMALQADIVLAPSFPGARRNYPSWAVDFLRRTFAPASVSRRRRLYIPRTTTRKVINEEAILSTLRAHNFEIFDPVLCENQPRHFAEAEIVVGAHGSGLAGLAFCQPGTRALELIPSDHILPYYYTLSTAGGLRYGYLIGDSVAERPPSSFGPSPYDFRIDESAFHNALTEIVEKSTTFHKRE